MPWIKFWVKGNCASGNNPETVNYEWHEKENCSEENLSECALDFAESNYWITQSERGFKYGFEEIDKLPEEVRLKLIKRYQSQMKNAFEMLLKLTKD